MDNRFKHIIDGYFEKLEEILPSKRIDLKKSNEGIQLSNNALYLLKLIVEKKGFKSIEEEIYFFKRVKSEPLSYLVYFSEVRSCELLMPKIGLGNQLNFLEKKIKRINKFFNRNWDFVHYMEQELTYLDVQYFTRSNQVFPLYSLPEACYLDPKFFTSHDMLWARIKGMNKFILYLQELIKLLKLQKHKALQIEKPKRALVWSASKAALTELIYALYSSSAVNNGKEDIKSIASAFEDLFNIRLDNIYKTYAEIKSRKDSKTRFLEELIIRFNQKVYEDDGI
ncbi:rteC protein [Arenibacter sp. NBRC 103722]|uniref:RteC domain-containing protein n=1 Tax=Arenibacter sp. NBRC 103722 TaxID=1113929 RepID=UPI0008534742|nr:RteC domain-containing protein [Arenibacter sp. NBRC 103722]GBF19662.1 rteC protein [Arenibacter sp. NBRC 103722]